ncbi:MAG: HPr kinase/phosphorylase, partial [Clostridia bacterium]|nr:HPr kinase/phosphorylase [Clostridia bacterium]
MSTTFSVPLSRIIKEMSLEEVLMPCDPDSIQVTSSQVNRPGVELTGFFKFYENSRILVFGNTEMAYLNGLENSERARILEELISRGTPALVLCRSFEPLDEMLSSAKAHSIPILRSNYQTSNFIATLVAFLNVELAPRITRHGVLVEVYGEGILLVGDSGVGKSETAIELVKRG